VASTIKKQLQMKKMEVTLEALKIKAVTKTLKNFIDSFFVNLLRNNQNSKEKIIYNNLNYSLVRVSLNNSFISKKNNQ
jgi:hypothetical protein